MNSGTKRSKNLYNRETENEAQLNVIVCAGGGGIRRLVIRKVVILIMIQMIQLIILTKTFTTTTTVFTLIIKGNYNLNEEVITALRIKVTLKIILIHKW